MCSLYSCTMQEAGEVLLNLMRSHAAAYRAIKAMPGAHERLKHLCQARCKALCRGFHHFNRAWELVVSAIL